MFISELDKCSDKTGTSHIKKIKEFASRCRVKSINVTDSSSFVLCNRIPSISLYLFEILRTGESWYNRMGFVSQNFASEQITNNAVRKMKLREIIYRINDTHNEITDNPDYCNNPRCIESISKNDFNKHRSSIVLWSFTNN
jgi:hypothetical protein